MMMLTKMTAAKTTDCDDVVDADLMMNDVPNDFVKHASSW